LSESGIEALPEFEAAISFCADWWLESASEHSVTQCTNAPSQHNNVAIASERSSGVKVVRREAIPINRIKKTVMQVLFILTRFQSASAKADSGALRLVHCMARLRLSRSSK
jgi:hypothetical protein